MRYTQTYLLTAGELHMAAAASGRKGLLMFGSEEKIGRAQQIQAVFRMMNEGFLLSENGVLRVGAPLVPLLEVFRRSTYAVVAQKADCATTPVCIYSGGQDFLCIAPHQYRTGLYEVSLHEPDDLINSLEARGLLPTALLCPDLNAEEFAGGICGKLEMLDKQWSDHMVRDAFADELLSTFERYRLSDQASVDKLLILKAPLAWCFVVRSVCPAEPTPYSHGAAAAWLKGASK